MTTSSVLLVIGVAIALGVSGGLAQRIALARSHRDVAAVAVRSVLLAAVLALGLSMVLAPGTWASAYDAVIDVFGGR